MDNRIKLYCWLISLLDRKHLTFQEIADEWTEASCNPFREELCLRTFHRHREAIRSQFGISIECNKNDGYRYYIKEHELGSNDVTEWMLSSMRLTALGDMLKYHNKVMLDTPPYNSEYLDDILRAIDRQYLLQFKYVTPYGVVSEMALVPAFVRYYKQRWYVIGVKIADPESTRCIPEDCKSHVRCLSFDRINYLKVIGKRYPLPAKAKKFLIPENYYADCYGIMRMEEEPPELIRIRAFYPEYNYIEEVPLHASQGLVKTSEDKTYREYELKVRPSRDFQQELLWHGRNIVVLKPESLRLKIIGILKDMAQSYKTGECMNEE